MSKEHRGKSEDDKYPGWDIPTREEILYSASLLMRIEPHPRFHPPNEVEIFANPKEKRKRTYVRIKAGGKTIAMFKIKWRKKEIIEDNWRFR